MRGTYAVGGRFRDERFPLGKKRGVGGLIGGNGEGRSGVRRGSVEGSERKMEGGVEGVEGVDGREVEGMVDVDGQEREGNGVEVVDEKDITHGTFEVDDEERVPMNEEAVRQMVEFTLMYF